VASLITDMLQWPHRIIVPLGGVDVDVRLIESDLLLRIVCMKLFNLFDLEKLFE
jgi:hypothetical protein